MKKLLWTDEEIVISYNEAKNKEEQVLILAQLNNCPIWRIRHAIDNNYVPTRDEQMKAPLDNKLLMELHGQGMSDQMMANITGVGRHRIELWRNKNGLKPNYKKYYRKPVRHETKIEVKETGKAVQWVTSRRKEG